MYSSWEHFGLSPPTCCCLSNTPCHTCVQSSPPPSRQSSPITAISHDALETFLSIYSLMVHYIPATTQHALHANTHNHFNNATSQTETVEEPVDTPADKEEEADDEASVTEEDDEKDKPKTKKVYHCFLEMAVPFPSLPPPPSLPPSSPSFLDLPSSSTVSCYSAG